MITNQCRFVELYIYNESIFLNKTNDELCILFEKYDLDKINESYDYLLDLKQELTNEGLIKLNSEKINIENDLKHGNMISKDYAEYRLNPGNKELKKKYQELNNEDKEKTKKFLNNAKYYLKEITYNWIDNL
jgi:hypothetical protein